MTITPRDYQLQAVDAVFKAWARGVNNGLVVIPTGGGKSLVMAMLIARIRKEHPGARILLTAHRAKLIEQNAAALRAWAPDVAFGICCSELRENCLSKAAQRRGVPPVVLATIMSVRSATKLAALGRRHVCIVDEAQLISHRQDTVYRKVLGHLHSACDGLCVVGATATPYRLSSGRLDEDYGSHKALFQRTFFEKPISELLRDGYLCEVVPAGSNGLARINTDAVGRRGGDFIARDLQAVSNIDWINQRAVAEIVAHGADRCAWLIFCAGLEHAKAVAALVAEHRYCGIVTADAATTGVYYKAATGGIRFEVMSRDKIFAAYDAKQLGALVNIDVLTVGFDAPHVDLIAALRPTESEGPWYQIVGRGMRLAPGKKNCLLLDFARNAGRIGPIDAIDGRKEAKGRGSAPLKECPECKEVVHASYRACPYCEHEFPAHTLDISPTPSADAILSHQIAADDGWRPVTDMVVREHKRRFKKGAQPTLAIDYICGLTEVHTRYLSFSAEYGSPAARLSREWWRRVVGSEAPGSVAAGLMLKDKIPQPKRIRLQRNGKYWNVAQEDYKDDKAEV